MVNETREILLAARFAAKAHHGQLRKYSGEPYITHPLAVADIVASCTNDWDLVVAAILHDVVEDTDVTPQEIGDTFGGHVAKLVVELTKITTPEDGNRATRAKIERDRLAKVSKEAKLIKLADLIHNSESIIQEDPEFAQTYIKEKADLLPVLREGHEFLYQTALEIVNSFLCKNP